jgi:hypothetical protein
MPGRYLGSFIEKFRFTAHRSRANALLPSSATLLCDGRTCSMADAGGRGPLGERSAVSQVAISFGIFE